MRIEMTVLTTPLMGLGEKIESHLVLLKLGPPFPGSKLFGGGGGGSRLPTQAVEFAQALASSYL